MDAVKKIDNEIDVYSLLPELLDLKQLQHLYRLSPGTIRRERWLQKKIKQQIKTEEEVDTSGFGFCVEPIPMYGKLYYRRRDVEKFIKSKQEKAPEELLKLEDKGAIARAGKKYLTESIKDEKKVR
tara:strand:- start:49 stop:426 length:378 start_codon:yes stop_codon:yes gene_type:complete